MENTKANPSQIRMAQDLACEMGHLNKGIESLWGLYKSAPALLEACRYSLNYLNALNLACPDLKEKLSQVINQAEQI
jgi:hypothetical protein